MFVFLFKHTKYHDRHTVDQITDPPVDIFLRVRIIACSLDFYSFFFLHQNILSDVNEYILNEFRSMFILILFFFVWSLFDFFGFTYAKYSLIAISFASQFLHIAMLTSLFLYVFFFSYHRHYI